MLYKVDAPYSPADEGGLLWNPSLGGADGGQVNNWGRAYPYGGVFDARADGTFEIDIDAKLGVAKLTAAAITIEKPGGVVVSKQEKLILLAKPESI